MTAKRAATRPGVRRRCRRSRTCPPRSSEGGRWRGRTRETRRRTLARYAARLMGRPVDQIDRAAVLSVLGPVYRDKPATGKLLRGWVRGVLAAAQALGHVDVNAAGEVIDAALPKTPKTRTHRRALRTPGAVVGGGCGGAGGHEAHSGGAATRWSSPAWAVGGSTAAPWSLRCGERRVRMRTFTASGRVSARGPRSVPGRRGTWRSWPLPTWSAGQSSGVTRAAICSTSGAG